MAEESDVQPDMTVPEDAVHPASRRVEVTMVDEPLGWGGDAPLSPDPLADVWRDLPISESDLHPCQCTRDDACDIAGAEGAAARVPVAGPLAENAPGAAADPGPRDAGMSGEELASVVPGLELTELLESMDPSRADEYQLVEMVAAFHRVAAWAQGRMVDLTGRLSRSPLLNPQSPLPVGPVAMNVTADELAPRLGISRFAARRLVEASKLFGFKLEDTATALREGRIDYPKACLLVRMLGDHPSDVAWEVQQAVLPEATHQTVTQLEKAVAKAIIAIDPHRATARCRKAREGRRVDHPRVLPDGMASMYAVLPATDAAGLDLALEAAARSAKAAGDTRTLDQLRADALALLGHGALNRGFIGEPPADRTPGDQGVSASAPTMTEGEPPASPTPPTPRDSSTPRDPSGTSAETDTGVPEVPEADADTRQVVDAGGSVRCKMHMPIGVIGGRRAQIRVTVPLSVLLPPEVLNDAEPGEWVVRLEGDSSARTPGGAVDQRPGDSPARDPGEPPGDVPEDEDDELPDLPEDWYPGPVPAEVAELDGYGPITPDVARALAYAGGTWQRLVTDPLTGALLDVGRERYRPPAAIEDFVRLRDGTCVRAGCSSPAHVCEADHVVPWNQGGVTSVATLGCLCKRDHIVKTSGAFQLHHEVDGSFIWTTPTGHVYRRDHTGRITPLPPASAVEAAQREVATGFGDTPTF